MANNQIEAIRAVSCVGRIIWGSVHEKVEKGYGGVEYEDGKEPTQFGLAVRKDDPGLPGMFGVLYQSASSGYASNQHMLNRINQEWQSGFNGLAFKFKVKDGDMPNAQGQKNPNAAGCYVFAFSTTLPIKCCDHTNKEIDPKMVERGYFADVAFSAKANGQTDATAGIYLNPTVVRLLAYGEKIIGGISPEEAFAGHVAPTNLPPGASRTPLASSSAGMPGQGFPTGLPNAQQGNMPANGQPNYSGQGMPQTGNGMPGSGGYPAQQMPQGGAQGMPQNGMPGSLPGGVPNAAGQQMPTGYATTLPGMGASPSNPGFPQGGGLPGGNGSSPTGYPINPQTGQPVMPHQQFANGPR